MGLVETEGLILRNYSLSDADKIVVVLTVDHGVVRGVAKGAKRLKSHFGSTLEPFSIVRISYFQKDQQELVSVRNSELVKSFFGLATEPAILQRMAYMADLIGEMVPQGEPSERIFNMTRVCLESFGERPEAVNCILVYFELWLLKLGGFLPDWTACSLCRLELPVEGLATIQNNFQLACSVCVRPKGGWTIGETERNVYALAQKMSPQKFVDQVGSFTEALNTISSVLRKIIAGIIGKEWHEDRILSAIYK